MEAGEIGTFDWNIRTGQVLWTEQSKAIFGHPSGISRGTYQNWSERVYPEDLVACEAGIREAFRNKLRH